MKYLQILVAISIILFSCKKKHIEEENSVTIQISEPQLSDTIAQGATVTVLGNITSTADIHGYTIEIINEENNTVLYSLEHHDHGTNTQFHDYWQNTVSDTTNTIAKITVVKNHDNQTEVKSVKFVCLP